MQFLGHRRHGKRKQIVPRIVYNSLQLCSWGCLAHISAIHVVNQDKNIENCGVRMRKFYGLPGSDMVIHIIVQLNDMYLIIKGTEENRMVNKT